jgi:tetratricopeptide (TPR) repeat protein
MSRFAPAMAAVAAATIGASLISPLGAAAEAIDRPITLEILPVETAASPALQNGTVRTSGATSQDSSRPDGQTAVLQQAFPGVLTAALIPYHHIQVITLPGRPRLQELGSDDRRQVNRTTSEIAKPSEFFVRSFVVVRGNHIVVNAVLNNRATGQVRRLNPATIGIDRVNTDVEPLAFIIANEIAKQKGVRFMPRSIYVACGRDSALPDAQDLEQAVQHTIASLARMLTLESGAKRIDWSTFEEKDCSPLQRLEELAKRERADALVVLYPRRAANHQEPAAVATIRWTIDIIAAGKRIPMADIAVQSTTPGADVGEFARQTTSLLSAIMTVAGEWRLADIPDLGEGAKEYLALGKRVAVDRNESPTRSEALQDYFFSIAVSRAAELSDTDASQAKFHLARIRLTQGRTKEVATLLSEADAQDRDNFDICMAQAELSFQLGRYDEAKERYADVIRRFPQRVEAYERLAVALTLRNEDEPAAQVYRNLKAAIPDALVAYRGLARISLTKGSWLSGETWNEAASFLEDGIRTLSDEGQRLQLKQELASLYADAGRAYYVRKDYRTALKFFDKSIAKTPSVRTHFYRAMTRYKEPGDAAQVLEDYSAVISLTEQESPPSFTPEYIGSKLGALEILTLHGPTVDAIARAEETLGLFTANKDLMSFEPVVRLIKLAAKIAGNIPSYRLDADDLRIVSNNSPRRYTYGSFYWQFDDVDQFIANHHGIPENLKCLYKQISHSVQNLPLVVCKFT